MDKLLTAAIVVMALAGAGAGAEVGLTPETMAVAAASTAAEPQLVPPSPPQVQKPPQPQPPPKPAGTPPAQTSPPSSPAGRAATPASSAAPKPAARTAAWLFVTTATGAPIEDAKVTLTGPVDREGTTSHEGSVRFTGMRAGTYRARFDAGDYILFEKELTIRAGQTLETEVTLNAAPVKKVEPPPPAPPPAPKPAPPPPEPAGDVSAVSIGDWIDKNMIGRNEPQRLSAIGQAPGAAAAILQVRETIADRIHTDSDEMLYVIAGEGSAVLEKRTQALSAGWFVVVPRDTPYTLARRGRNPLILLSILAPARGSAASPR